MRPRTIMVAAVLLLGVIEQARAAEMTLVRNSRPVTAAEIAGGAPSGGMVHDFYATSDADLLTLATHFSQSVYQHPYGSNNAAPPSELIVHFPAVGADSFFTLPSSTIVLGGGFNGLATEKAWGDLSNDGPQSNFLFGRLTTTEPGSFAGSFALRGEETFVPMGFNFTLPGPSGPLSETLTLLDSESMARGGTDGPTDIAPPEPSPPSVYPSTFDPLAYAKKSKADIPVAVELERITRPVTGEEIAAGTPDGYVHEFFVSSSTDVIGIRDVKLDVPVYQDKFGLDNRAPGPSRLALSLGVSASSFLDTPSQTYVVGGFAAAQNGSEATWYDRNNNGPQDDFLFARLTVSETGNFSGSIDVMGPNGPIEVPFDFVLPGTAKDLELIENETAITVAHPLEAPQLVQATVALSQIPEPSALLLAAFAGAALVLRRHQTLELTDR